jgi:HSP20 family molecular chaperone IbpA
MELSDERNEIRLYRKRWLREWQIHFHPREVDSLFEELIHKRWGRSKWQPKTDVLRTAAGYVVEMDLPGVEEDVIRVIIRGRYLAVEGRRVTGRSARPEGIMLCERPEGFFSRGFEFAENLEDYHVQKSVRNGVLTLVLTRK